MYVPEYAATQPMTGCDATLVIPSEARNLLSRACRDGMGELLKRKGVHSNRSVIFPSVIPIRSCFGDVIPLGLSFRANSEERGIPLRMAIPIDDTCHSERSE